MGFMSNSERCRMLALFLSSAQHIGLQRFFIILDVENSYLGLCIFGKCFQVIFAKILPDSLQMINCQVF